MAVVLDEVVDEDYEPTHQEIREYGEWLGMDLDQDEDLLWIAREGLKAPLPKSWKPCQSSDGDIFYFNFETGDSVWDHPCDEHYRKLYRRAKARRDAPQRLVSISGWMNESGMLTVTCAGSLNGDCIASLVFKRSSKVRSLRSALAKQLEVAKRCVRLILPDDRLVAELDDKISLGKLLGFCDDSEEALRCRGKNEEGKKPRKAAKSTGTQAGRGESDPPNIVILDSALQEDYEPGEADIENYAKWLGMDLEKDRDLLWVASDGLKAPLPAHWRPCKTSDGDIFYYNTETCKSFWDHPCDDHYRRLLQEVRERQSALRQSPHEDDRSDDLSEHLKEVPERPHTIRQSSLKAASESCSSSSSTCLPSAASCSSSPSSSSLGYAEMHRQRSPKALPPLTSFPRLSVKSEGLNRDASVQEFAG